MSDIDISTPNTAFKNMQDGSILLFQKNSDGTEFTAGIESQLGGNSSADIG